MLHRKCSTEVIPPAQAEGTDKVYAPKLQKIVDDISKLTLLEVADLNELLKVNRYSKGNHYLYIFYTYAF